VFVGQDGYGSGERLGRFLAVVVRDLQMNLPAVRISNDPVTSLGPGRYCRERDRLGSRRREPDGAAGERAIAAGPHFDAGAGSPSRPAFGEPALVRRSIGVSRGVMRNRTDSRRGTVMTRTVNRALRPAWERT